MKQTVKHRAYEVRQEAERYAQGMISGLDLLVDALHPVPERRSSIDTCSKSHKVDRYDCCSLASMSGDVSRDILSASSSAANSNCSYRLEYPQIPILADFAHYVIRLEGTIV